MKKNPFIFGSPIQDRSLFFGRKEIEARVLNRLRSMQDSSIIGERRMGKTSLLYHLQEDGVLRKHGLEPTQYLLIYFSFEGTGPLTPTRFWQRLLHTLLDKINDGELHGEMKRLYAMEQIDPFDIEDLFLNISAKGLKIVFLLDEFETVTQATNLDADFFSHLRSLATGRFIGLVFVTSSRQKLSELSHAGIVGSPFFNIFETFFLRPFSLDSARTMLEAQLTGTQVIFDPREQEYLLTLSGRQPFFLQMAASYLFDTFTIQGLTDSSLRPARLERVEQEFLLQVDPHLAHYWQQSTDHEKIFLLALSVLRFSASDQKRPDMDAMKRAYQDADVAARILGDRGLVQRSSGYYQIFSPAYERWVLKELTQSTSRADFKAWLEQNEPYYGRSLQPLFDHATDIASFVSSKYWNLLTEWLAKSEYPIEILQLLKDAARQTEAQPLWLSFVEV